MLEQDRASRFKVLMGIGVLTISLTIGNILGISVARMLTLHLSFAEAIQSTLRDWIWLSGVIGGFIGYLASIYVIKKRNGKIG
jgi:hypothetical protein